MNEAARALPAGTAKAGAAQSRLLRQSAATGRAKPLSRLGTASQPKRVIDAGSKEGSHERSRLAIIAFRLRLAAARPSRSQRSCARDLAQAHLESSSACLPKPDLSDICPRFANGHRSSRVRRRHHARRNRQSHLETRQRQTTSSAMPIASCPKPMATPNSPSRSKSAQRRRADQRKARRRSIRRSVSSST